MLDQSSYLNLCVTLRVGDTENLARLIAEGADVNYVTGDDYTPIFTAVETPYVDTLDLLIKAGADVNHVNEMYDVTPLTRAVCYGNLGIIKLLLESGADVNWRSDLDFSAGAFVCAVKQKGVVDLFLDYDVETDHIYGALDSAICFGDRDTVEIILGNRPDSITCCDLVLLFLRVLEFNRDLHMLQIFAFTGMFGEITPTDLLDVMGDVVPTAFNALHIHKLITSCIACEISSEDRFEGHGCDVLYGNLLPGFDRYHFAEHVLEPVEMTFAIDVLLETAF